MLVTSHILPFYMSSWAVCMYRDPFFLHDGPHGGQGAFVHRTLDILMGQWVRQGVDLELEADFDDVKRGDAESIKPDKLAIYPFTSLSVRDQSSIP